MAKKKRDEVITRRGRGEPLADLDQRLYGFQRVGRDFLKDKRRAILADDMGLGKTVQALAAARDLDNRRVLIVAPRTVMHVWKRHIEEWLPECTCLIVPKKPDERDLAIATSDANFLIVHYKQLLAIEEALEYKPWTGFIFDESHKLKSRKSKAVTMTMLPLVRANPQAFLFALTGTPILNRPEEIWTSLHMCDPVLFSSFERWLRTYMQVTYNPYQSFNRKKIGPILDVVRFKAHLEPFVLRREKDGTIDLPPITHEVVELEMEGEQLKRYRTMEEQCYADLGGGRELAATVIIAQLTRLKQLAIAAEAVEYGDVPIAGCKAEAIDEIIDSAFDQQVLIFSQFANVIKKLSQRFSSPWGPKHAVITGETDDHERVRIMDDFQAGKYKVLLMTTQLGQGMTLTAASIVIMVDKLWTPGYNQQAIDRAHRVGQDKPVTVYHLRTLESIDSYIDRLLAAKRNIIEAVIEPNEVLDDINAGNELR